MIFGRVIFVPAVKTGHCYETIPSGTVVRRSDPYQPFRRRSVSEWRFYISFQDIFHILAIQFLTDSVKIANNISLLIWFLLNITDFCSYYKTIHAIWQARLLLHVLNYRSYFTQKKCEDGSSICIRGSGKTRKQIKWNSTPHLYRMTFTYGYTCWVLLLSPASIWNLPDF